MLRTDECVLRATGRRARGSPPIAPRGCIPHQAEQGDDAAAARPARPPPLPAPRRQRDSICRTDERHRARRGQNRPPPKRHPPDYRDASACVAATTMHDALVANVTRRASRQQPRRLPLPDPGRSRYPRWSCCSRCSAAEPASGLIGALVAIPVAATAQTIVKNCSTNAPSESNRTTPPPYPGHKARARRRTRRRFSRTALGAMRAVAMTAIPGQTAPSPESTSGSTR